MNISVCGINVFYERYDGVGEPILLLHGWGASQSAMSGLFNFIKSKGRSAIALDFPYFGLSEKPPTTYGTYEYANLTAEFLKALDIKKLVIIGHSFGGRIGIILAANYDLVSKLVLIDSAGAKPRFSLKKKLKIWLYKIKKKLRIISTEKAGSNDYKNLPTEMKAVFVRVVNTHLDKLFFKIQIPTLLLWGENDKDTPLYMAKRMRSKIKDSAIIVLKDAGHFSFADKFTETCQILNAFI